MFFHAFPHYSSCGRLSRSAEWDLIWKIAKHIFNGLHRIENISQKDKVVRNYLMANAFYCIIWFVSFLPGSPDLLFRFPLGPLACLSFSLWFASIPHRLGNGAWCISVPLSLWSGFFWSPSCSGSASLPLHGKSRTAHNALLISKLQYVNSFVSRAEHIITLHNLKGFWTFSRCHSRFYSHARSFEALCNSAWQLGALPSDGHLLHLHHHYYRIPHPCHVYPDDWRIRSNHLCTCGGPWPISFLHNIWQPLLQTYRIVYL